MYPGVNANGASASIPVTRSQHAAAAAAGLPVVDDPKPAVTPLAGTAMVCTGCSAKTNTINNLTAEGVRLNERIDVAQDELSGMAMKLEASSGVTINARQATTIKRLQGLEEVQRVANDNLEWENRVLRELCEKNKLDYEGWLDAARVKK